MPIVKGLGDRLACSSYHGMKLLKHELQVSEIVPEKQMKRMVSIREQFGFMLGRGTTDAIFVVRQ